MVLLGVVAVGFGLSRLSQFDGQPAAAPATPGTRGTPDAAAGAQHSPTTGARTGANAPGASLQVPRTAAGDERPEPGQREAFEKDFAGRATIRGQVQVAEGVEFPEQWELVLAPSKYVEGSEKAEYRSVTFTGGERTFEVHDLPLGGYDVSARAAGLNGVAVSVLLYKIAGRPDLPGARTSYVSLVMTPAGFLDGSVVDRHGRPVGNLPVSLTAPDTLETLHTTTDPAGNYLFPVVLDGKYELIFGDPDRPLREVEWFTFMAPSMRYPEVEVPAFVDLDFQVVDETGAPVADAGLRGYGDPSGTLDLVTDGEGRATARFLSPGRYRVKAKRRSGELGKVDFEVFPADREKLVEIVIKP